MALLFQAVEIVYWLALSTWFGGVLFVAIAAPIIFRTLRHRNPILPDVLSVNLEGQHAALLSGEIVGNILAALRRVEVICAVALVLALAGQCFVTSLGVNLAVRATMFVAAVVLAVYDARVLWPRIWKHRQDYIDHADEPDIANAARERFDADHRDSVTILSIVLFLLLGMILFSGAIAPTFITFR